MSYNGVGDGLRVKFCAKGGVECLCAWSEGRWERN